MFMSMWNPTKHFDLYYLLPIMHYGLATIKNSPRICHHSWAFCFYFNFSTLDKTLFSSSAALVKVFASRGLDFAPASSVCSGAQLFHKERRLWLVYRTSFSGSYCLCLTVLSREWIRFTFGRGSLVADSDCWYHRSPLYISSVKYLLIIVKRGLYK
ncbi:hypothetical protein SAMN05428981_105167 [Bacillus sp. OV194]|nr:hypothetical protein SAMN05428981_105167 [Bacillus sp. OV194]